MIQTKMSNTKKRIALGKIREMENLKKPLLYEYQKYTYSVVGTNHLEMKMEWDRMWQCNITWKNVRQRMGKYAQKDKESSDKQW